MVGETKTSAIPSWVKAVAVGRRPGRTLVRLALLISLALVAFVVLRFVLLPVQITGPSMYPTFRDGSLNFINCLAYLRHEPQRGDVVGIRFSDSRVMLVKRIVGMPGEVLYFSRGKVYINGKALPEPYLKLPSKDWESPPKQLGPEEFYVVGDNRSMSFENHTKGGAERKRIIGKILLGGES